MWLQQVVKVKTNLILYILTFAIEVNNWNFLSMFSMIFLKKVFSPQEALRNHIILEVKQSMTLNSDGAENLKANELSDGIHNEIGYNLNDLIILSSVLG